MLSHRVLSALVVALAIGAGAQGQSSSSAFQTDRYGDSLPAGAVARLGSIKFNHLDRINSIAFTLDGRFIASAGKSRQQIEWDPALGKVIDKLGRGTDKVIRIWDCSTGSKVRDLHGHEDSVLHIALSSDGKTLASASRDKTIRLWDVTSTGQGRILKGHGSAVCYVVFSRDGKTLASSDDVGQIRLWAVATGKEIGRIDQRKKDEPYLLTFSPDGKTLFRAQLKGGHAVEQWEVAAGKELRSTRKHENGINSISSSPDGRLLASADPTELVVWDVTKWKELWSSRESGNLSAIAFSPNGKSIASCGTNGIIVWNADTGKRLHTITPGQFKSPNAVAFSPDGKLLASDAGGNFIRFWETTTWRELFHVPGHESRIRCVAFSSNGKALFSSCDDDSLCKWDTVSDLQLKCFRDDPLDDVGRGTTMAIFSMVRSPFQTIVAGSSVGRMYLIDERTGRPIRILFVRINDSIDQVAFSPNGKMLIWGVNIDAIYIWEVDTGAEPRKMQGNEPQRPSRQAPGFLFTISPDGKTFLSGQKGEPYIFRDISTGKERHRLTSTPIAFRLLRFLPDGKTLISLNDDNTICIWDAGNGKQVRKSKYTQSAKLASLAPNGKTLAVANMDGTIALWDIAAGQERHRFDGHQGGVSCLAFSQDCNLLASGSEDATILIWDVETHKLSPATGLDASWDALGSDDIIIVRHAISALVEGERREPGVLLARVRPLFAVNQGQVRRLIQLLSDQDFDTREKAGRDLAALGDVAEPALRKALATQPQPDLQKRLEKLVSRLEQPEFTAREFRLQRTLDILERIATKEAQEAIAKIAKEAPGRWLHNAANETQQRIESRR